MQQILKNINKKYLPKNYKFAPEWIVLGVNNVCNLHCKMCDVGTKNLESNFAQNLVGTHPINMPLVLIKKIIDEISNFYPKSKLAYAFTEPLVYPHVIESLEYANQKKIYTTLTTNALTLNQKAVELSEVNLDELFVSLDGPEIIHNEIRGHKKSFQKALSGIKKLTEQTHVPKITVICAITEWNIGHLFSFLSELRSLPIKEVAFMHTQFNTLKSADLHNQSQWGKSYPSTESNMDYINFENMDLKTLSKEILKIKSTQHPFSIYFSPEISTEKELNTYYKEHQTFIGKSCNAVYTNMMIKSDGSVIPAHGRCYNLEIGNVYKNSLKEIWNSSVISKFRNDLKLAGGLFPGCSRCCSAV